MNAKETIRALVIDDEKVVRDFLTHFLSLKGVETTALKDGFEAIEAAKREKFDIVFLELSMLRKDATWVLKELKKINPHSEYVVMCAYFQEDLWKEAEKEGATVCFKKPFEIDELMQEINKIRCLKGL